MNDILNNTVEATLDHGMCAKKCAEACTKNAWKLMKFSI